MAQETGNRLISAINKQTEKVVYFCAAENISPNLAVHEIRKAFKRIRALLQFYNENPDKFYSNSNKEIKGFGRLIAPMRESFVNAQIFEKISGNRIIHERKVKKTKDLLLEKNKTVLIDWNENRNCCNSISTFIDDFESKFQKNEVDFPSKMQILQGLKQSFKLCFEIYNELNAQSNGNDFHELRKKMKQLWYQLDFIKFRHPRYFRLKAAQLNKITELLGEDHDYYILLEELNSGNYGFDNSELNVLENQIEHFRELNQIKLWLRLKQFFNESPEQFSIKLEKIFKISS